MPLDAAALESLAAAFLERQPWYLSARERSGELPLQGRPVLLALHELAPLPVGLARLLLGAGEQRFQLLVGWRQPNEAVGVLRASEASLLGPLHDGGLEALAYDALADSELCLALLSEMSGGGERAERVRHVSSLVSHDSLVFDERLFMKCYRVLIPGGRPELELIYRLDDVGFNAMLAPVARWRGDGFDLALVREFVANGLEGRELAFTSLRDLLAGAASDARSLGEVSGPVPIVAAAAAAVAPGGAASAGQAAAEADRAAAAEADRAAAAEADRAAATEADRAAATEADRAAGSAGGDLASEMGRLGTTTASLHVALVAAFGEAPLDAEELAARVPALATGALGHGGQPGAHAPLGGLGSRIRLHGDYHLRRVMRTEAGWLVVGFGDDPLYGEQAGGGSLAVQHGSPLEDLADLCFALEVVASEAVARRPAAEATTARRLASAWVRRNREAFLAGYRSLPAAAALLPADSELADALLDALVEQRVER